MIKLTIENQAKIQAALDAVNGRARSFAITSGYAVINLGQKAEQALERQGVAKSNRAGAVLYYLPAGPSASAYRYAAASTRLVLLRRTSGWYLVSATADTVYPRGDERFELVPPLAVAEARLAAAQARLDRARETHATIVAPQSGHARLQCLAA